MMANSAMYLVLVVLFASCVVSQREPTTYAGTTENIEDVFVGRCWDYDVTRYKGLLPRVEEDCSTLWNHFTAGFTYMPPCAVSTEGYNDYFDAASQNLPEGKVMFWSGVYALAHRFSDAARNYVTLEDTMIGYLVNSLTWCGQSTEPGMNFTRCPEWNDCPEEASESFWAGASTKYAREAFGDVTLMVGGSDPNKKAYRRDSFFAKHELPNLSRDVTKVIVLVTHVLGQEQLETCANGSLVDLREDVTNRGFVYECIDDPKSVMHLLCADDPAAEECQLVQSHSLGNLSYPGNDTPRTFNGMAADRFNS